VESTAGGNSLRLPPLFDIASPTRAMGECAGVCRDVLLYKRWVIARVQRRATRAQRWKRGIERARHGCGCKCGHMCVLCARERKCECEHEHEHERERECERMEAIDDLILTEL
jgi:hypothetical protein